MIGAARQNVLNANLNIEVECFERWAFEVDLLGFRKRACARCGGAAVEILERLAKRWIQTAIAGAKFILRVGIGEAEA